MRAVCIVFGVPPHYLILSFLYDESQAQPQATELRQKKGREMWLEFSSSQEEMEEKGQFILRCLCTTG